MNTQWMLDTHGDPLGTLRGFINTVWQGSELEGMIVPLNGSPDAIAEPRLIETSEQLADLNPFIPLMTVNTASLIPEIINEHPGMRLGVMMRPCELRALIEMVKHNMFSADDILTICVDCLGTFPVEDFHWRAERKGAPEKLTQETLQFARQGGINPYRYRSACQVCTAPEARGASLNIGILGLPVRQHILITARDERTAARLHLDQVTNAKADSALVSQHECLLAKLVARNRHTHERVINSLADVLPKDIDALIEQLESCINCQDCMDVCPICVVDHPQRSEDGKYVSEEITRWVISCAGCGMCESACSQHLPLNIIFVHIRAQLAEYYSYSPATSIQELLPTI